MSDQRLERWLEALLSTPGLTSIRDRTEARRVHVEDALAGAAIVGRYEGPIVDVGSGGGSPGIPLAVALPQREVILLEASRRKAAFLERLAREFPNVRVVNGRAEEQETEAYGVAVARALAPPPVATEWCLPLVAVGGAAVLWLGPTADRSAVTAVAELLGGSPATFAGGLAVIEKLAPTPHGFPRRAGVARKRPLA